MLSTCNVFCEHGCCVPYIHISGHIACCFFLDFHVWGVPNFCPSLLHDVGDCKYSVHWLQLCYLAISMDLHLFKIIKIDNNILLWKSLMAFMSVGHYIARKPKHALRPFPFFLTGWLAYKRQLFSSAHNMFWQHQINSINTERQHWGKLSFSF